MTESYLVEKWTMHETVDTFSLVGDTNAVSIVCYNESRTSNLLFDAMKRRKHVIIRIEEEKA